MGQLVETDQRDLSTLPVMHGGFELQMRKLDLAAIWPAPLMHSVMRSATSPRIKTEALIPQCSRVGDLRCRAPEEYRREVRNAADVAQRLQKQSDRLPAARRTAVNADIGGGSKKLSLRSRLCRDYAFWRWRHLSRLLGAVYALSVEGGARPDTMSAAGLVCTRPPSPSVSGMVAGIRLGGPRRGCRLRVKYLSCALRRTSVSSGSRLLSGRTRTTFELASGPLPGIEPSGAVRSRQFALVFSQKMIAAILLAFAAANK